MHYSRFCGLDKTQLQYVNTISYIVADISHIPKKMTKITDFLYLGNFEDSTDVKTLKEEGITHILNTVDALYQNTRTGQGFYGPDFIYHGFTSQDEESYPIMQHFRETFDFIESAQKADGKCLIHCIAGINRSGCLAVAYLMASQNIGPISAVKIVFQKRGMLLSNTGFIERLVKFAVDRDLLFLDKEQLLNRFVVSE